jgi:hypothetical protein
MRSGLAMCLAMLLAACTFRGLGTEASASTLTPEPTPDSTATAPPTPSPTPMPTPTPGPTPTPDPAAMTLEATSCNGGVVLRWSPSRHPDFHHYIGLRSPEKEIAVDYPPIAPAVDWGDLYVTDRFVTIGFDATVVPSSTTWHYRVVGYDDAGRVVSRSDVASGRIRPHRSLGPIRAEVLDDGRVRMAWRRFDGVAECFSAYRVLHGTDGAPDTLLSTVTDPTAAELETVALHRGMTYTLRVQAVHTTTLGHFVLGESDLLTVSLPEP